MKLSEFERNDHFYYNGFNDELRRFTNKKIFLSLVGDVLFYLEEDKLWGRNRVEYEIIKDLDDVHWYIFPIEEYLKLEKECIK